VNSVDVDPIRCAQIAANLLHSSGGIGIVEEASAWAQLGHLLVSIRDHSIDNAAHEVAHAAFAYVVNADEGNLAELHRTLTLWRSKLV